MYLMRQYYLPSQPALYAQYCKASYFQKHHSRNFQWKKLQGISTLLLVQNQPTFYSISEPFIRKVRKTTSHKDDDYTLHAPLSSFSHYDFTSHPILMSILCTERYLFSAGYDFNGARRKRKSGSINTKLVLLIFYFVEACQKP